jgi:hypothetical protein
MAEKRTTPRVRCATRGCDVEPLRGDYQSLEMHDI